MADSIKLEGPKPGQGKRRFRESILGSLEQIEGPVLEGGRLDEGSVMGQEGYMWGAMSMLPDPSSYYFQPLKTLHVLFVYITHRENRDSSES